VLLVGGGAVIAALAIAAAVLGQGTGKTEFEALKSPSLSSRSSTVAGPVTIDGVTCDPQEHVTYHVHTHLSIRVHGESETIPGDVGRTSNCLFWLHTHAALGVIHVEAPVARTFTLAQFFAVWAKPLSANQVGDWAVPAGSRIWVYVDGQPTDVDPATIELANLRSIELQIGPSRLDPAPYDWPAEYR
jgi:hypothetical protein